MYGKVAPNISRLISIVNSNPRKKGETDFSDRPHSDRPTTVVNEDMAKKADTRRLTIVKVSKQSMVMPVVKCNLLDIQISMQSQFPEH